MRRADLAMYDAKRAGGGFFIRPLPGAELTTWLEDSPFGADGRGELPVRRAATAAARLAAPAA